VTDFPGKCSPFDFFSVGARKLNETGQNDTRARRLFVRVRGEIAASGPARRLHDGSGKATSRSVVL